MDDELVKTGIDIIGSVPWGTHFCQFYQTKEDLLDTLVPYFKAGLENNEFCIWVTAEPLTAQDADEAMRGAIADFADRLDNGQIEILPHTEWYLKGGTFDQQRVLDGWVEKLDSALAAGYAGLRLSGNTFWLEKRDWRSFTDYEAAVNEVIGKYRMLALCTYSLDKCGAAEVMDVIRNHEFALIRKEGEWELIENAIYRQTKESMRRSEERFRSIFEESPVGIVLYDPNGRLVTANNACLRILGVSELNEVKGFGLFEDPNVSDEVKEQLRRGETARYESLFDFEKVKEHQLYSTSRSGTARLDVMITPIGTGGGEAAGGYLVQVQDITRRKEMEDELRRSHDLMEAVTDGTGVIVATQDANYRYTYFNKAYREEIKRLTGKDLHVGDSMIDLFADMPDQQRVAAEEWSRMLRGETVTQRIEFGDPSRHRSVYSVFHTPIRSSNGSVVGGGEVAFDISQQVQMEEALRQSEARLKKAQEIAHLGSWELDLHNNHLIWSDEVYRIFGLQPQEFRATYEAFLDAVYPDDRAAVDSAYSSSLREGRDTYEIEHRVVRRSNGEIRFVHERCEHVRDRSGRVVRSVGMVQDITERRQAEVALRESEEKYRLLFQNMAEGFALYELLYDERGQPVDWRVLEMNDAYNRHSGIAREKVLGRRIGEVYPEVVQEYLPRFAHVVATQVPVEFETYSRPAGRYMRVNTFPAGGHRFASTFEDISKRVEAERRTQLLAETASELLKSDSPQMVVNNLCAKVMAFLDCQAFFNFLADESAGRLRLNAYAGISDEQAREIEWLDYGVAICGCAAQDACRLVAENILGTSDPRTELVKSYGIQAYACHPLMAQNRVLGTLSFGTKTRTRFTDEELSLMKAVADLVAIAMQRKRTEDTLRETHDYLDSLLNYANAPIIVWDPELRITRFNRAFQRLTGHTESEALGQRLDMLFPKESREQSLSQIHRAVAGERWETVEIPILRVDGEARIVLWNSANIHASDGVTTVATIAQGQDITVRKLAEKALRDSEERHRLVFEAAMDGFWVTDLSGRLLQVNDAYCKMSGYTRQELLGMHVSEIEAIEKPEETAEHIQKVFREGQDRFETRHRRKDGSLVDIEVSVKYSDVRDGQLIVSARDITERKQAQEQLEFQASILSHLFDAVVAVDSDHRVTYWNTAAADLYGVSRQEAIGQTVGNLYRIDWLSPEDERDSAESMATKGHWTGDQFHVKKTGDRMYVRVSESVIRNADGAPGGMVAVTRDRTKLWQAEQEVKLLNERLRQQAEDRLRATDASFRRAIASSADGIVVVRKDGIIRFANPAAEGLLGQGAGEMVGTLFRFPLVEGTEIEIPKKNGEKAIAEMRIVELDWEGAPAYLATLRDITRRKQGLLALQESETRLRLLLDQIPCVSWTLDTKMRFTSFAGSGLGIFRDVPDQILGMTLAEYFKVDDLDFVPYVAHRQALQGTPATYEVSWAERTFYGRVDSLRGADDHIVGVVGVAFDITDRKQAEEQLRNLSHRLVAAQENERRKIARELHDEIGQSLTALKLSLDRASPARSARDRSELGEAREALRELMTRVRSMSLDLRPTMLDDLGLLPTLLWHFKRYTAQTNVRVHFKHRGLRKDLTQDIVTAAYRIVQEALTNVARHAQVNEVLVCVRAEHDALVVEVEDQGVGFDLDSVTSASMGLNGMRERALSLNGKLLVQSKLGEGTCVIAELPLAKRRSKRTRSKENDNRSSG